MAEGASCHACLRLRERDNWTGGSQSRYAREPGRGACIVLLLSGGRRCRGEGEAVAVDFVVDGPSGLSEVSRILLSTAELN